VRRKRYQELFDLVVVSSQSSPPLRGSVPSTSLSKGFREGETRGDRSLIVSFERLDELITVVTVRRDNIKCRDTLMVQLRVVLPEATFAPEIMKTMVEAFEKEEARNRVGRRMK
jgi:hypothetical protein